RRRRQRPPARPRAAQRAGGLKLEREDIMIHVIAIITAKPGQRETILGHFRANVPAVKAEKGCIEYGATVDVENGPPFQTKWGADTFLVVEKWESMDALKAHAA